MVIATAAGLHRLHNGATVAVCVVLASVFGYAPAMRAVLRAQVPFRQAGKLLAADVCGAAATANRSAACTVPLPTRGGGPAVV